MAEIMTDPVKIIIQDVTFEGFGEHHSLADIARWIMKNISDAEDLYSMLGEMILEANRQTNPATGETR